MVSGVPIASPAEAGVGGKDEMCPVERFGRGDATVFERIVALHEARVRRLAYRLLGWSDGVEDVVQEVFLTVLTKLNTFRGESGFASWLTAVTVNKCRNHRRFRLLRLRREPDVARHLDRPNHGEPDRSLGDRQTCEQVRRAVRSLPARYREVVVLRYLEGLDVGDVADALAVSKGTVEVRLSRARERLRAVLGGLMEV